MTARIAKHASSTCSAGTSTLETIVLMLWWSCWIISTINCAYLIQYKTRTSSNVVAKSFASNLSYYQNPLPAMASSNGQNSNTYRFLSGPLALWFMRLCQLAHGVQGYLLRERNAWGKSVGSAEHVTPVLFQPAGLSRWDYGERNLLSGVCIV